MNDQFPRPGWFMRPETWPYWMPNSLTGARTLPETPKDVWASYWAGKLRGGILGNLARPLDEFWPNTWAATAVPVAMSPAFWPRLLPELDWSQNSAPPPYQFPVRNTFAGIGDETISKPPTEPGLEPTSVTAPTVSSRSPAKPSPPFYGPGDVLLPAPEPEPPPPPKDFRTWLRDALSDKNVRYYAGPHLYDALLKLHALTQLLPGSGRYCCKSPKSPGDNFPAIRRSDRRPPICVVSITLPRSPVSLSSGDEVPHIFTRKSRLQPGEFLITSAKRLLQHNRH
jgi:hypothetical protein